MSLLSFNNDSMHLYSQNFEINLAAEQDRLDHIGFGINELSLTLTKSSRMAHVIADKNNKILYCAIPKNSCTIFKLLFQILADPQQIHQWKHEKPGHIHFAMDQSLFINAGKSHLFGANKVLQTFADYIHDNDWRKLVVIRDPLERLLSAYLDKCVAQNMDCFKYKTEIWNGDIAIAHKSNFSIFVNHFKHKLSEWENSIKPYHAKWKNVFSNHFSPQYAYCNLEKISKLFTDVIYYHHSTINDETETFLKSLNNVDIEWFYKWGKYSNQTLFNGKPIHVTSKDLSNDLKIQTRFYQQYYDNREYAEGVMSLFEKDYKLFNIPRPRWIDNF